MTGSATLFAPVFALARWIMPATQQHWVSAMKAEILATPSWLQKLDLSYGLVLSACSQRLSIQLGIAWFGRHGIALCLVVMGAMGVAIAGDMENNVASAIMTMSCGYTIIGLSALGSIELLKRCAFSALIMFAALLLLRALSITRSALDGFYFALLFEGAVLMVALILAATILPRLAWVEHDAL